MKLRKIKNVIKFSFYINETEFFSVNIRDKWKYIYLIHPILYILYMFLYYEWFPLELVFTYNICLIIWFDLMRKKIQTMNTYCREPKEVQNFKERICHSHVNVF